MKTPMARSEVITLLGIVLCFFTGSNGIDTYSSDQTRIYGGTDSKEGEWPWQVSVQSNGSHICGGSLISNEWVMSAAHCFEGNINPIYYKVILGMYHMDNPTPYQIEATVEKIIPSPDFVKIGSKGDIALMKLSSPVNYNQYIQPINLPAEMSDCPCGFNCWTTGWGATENSSSPSNGILQKVMVPIIDPRTCDQWYHVSSSENATTVLVHSYEICAGYIDGKKDACQGDSGGPLVCNIQGVWYQAGIVSWGDSCGVPYRPGVFSLVPVYQRWILKYVPNLVFTKLTIPTARVDCFDYIYDPDLSASSPLWTGQKTWILLVLSVIFCTLWSGP